MVAWWWLIVAAMGGATVGVLVMCLFRNSSEYEESQMTYLNTDIKKDGR